MLRTSPLYIGDNKYRTNYAPPGLPGPDRKNYAAIISEMAFVARQKTVLVVSLDRVKLSLASFRRLRLAIRAPRPLSVRAPRTSNNNATGELCLIVLEHR